MRFSSGKREFRHIANPTLLSEFKWVDLQAEGETDMGQAFALLAEDLAQLPQNTRMLPPQVVLISRRQANR